MSGKLPLLKVNFGKDLNCVSLLDSGCSRSLISKKLFSALKENKLIKSHIKSNHTLEVANGGKMVTRSEVKIHLKIELFSWNFDFLVVNNLPFDMIIGFDFMKYSKLSLNLNKEQIKFNFSEKENVFYLVDAEEDEMKPDKRDLGDADLTDKQRLEFKKLLEEYSKNRSCQNRTLQVKNKKGCETV